ncbi:MAG: sulfite exporter TauE/SafE family protein [Burkholderiales bacterium]|nr:sulfite exporter TauE/SafE family protein [Burkholderiales bacterium]
MSGVVWIAAPLVAVFAYLVFGLTGFGSTVILVPALAFFLPLRLVVPLVLLLDLAAAILLRQDGAPQRDRVEVRRLLPFMLVGMLLGVLLLAYTPERWLMLVLGLFIALVGARGLFMRTATALPIAPGWVVPAGFIGGIASSLYGTGGVIFAMYASRRIDDPARLRGTMAALIAISAVVRLGLFLLAGLMLEPELWLAWLALLPCAWIGLKLGVRWHARVDIVKLRMGINILLIAGGLGLALRA